VTEANLEGAGNLSRMREAAISMRATYGTGRVAFERDLEPLRAQAADLAALVACRANAFAEFLEQTARENGAATT